MRRPLRCLELFAGIGGQALALKRSGCVRSVAYCEKDPEARRVLRDNMQAGWLDAAPIFHDVRTLLQEKRLPRKVDLVAGGFPCQDLSAAGKRAGLVEGERSSLVFDVLDIVAALRPSFVFLENVAAIVQRGHEYLELLRRLANTGDGYDLHVTFVSAGEVGARHARNRWFCLAVRRGSPPLALQPEECDELRRFLRARTALVAPRDGRVARAASRFFGNAVVPAACLRAFVQLHAAARGPAGPAVDEAAWRRSAPMSLIRGELRQHPTAQPPPPGCQGEAFELEPPAPRGSRHVLNTLPPLTEPFTASCAPTPRTGANTMLSSRVLTDRTKRDLGTFLMSTSKVRRHLRRHARHLDDAEHRAHFMVSPELIESFMGFPRGWLKPFLTRPEAVDEDAA